MKVSDLLASRLTNWNELEQLCDRMGGRSQKKIPAPMAARFASLYRAACADLALADAYQLPPRTVAYLHQLVGRAHNQLYRSRMFHFARWTEELLVHIPRRLFADKSLRLAFVIFWGVFLLSLGLACRSGDYAEQVIGKEMLVQLDDSFARSLDVGADDRTLMVGFYIYNNAGIGLRCFAFGLVFGVGGLFTTVFNAGFLGAVFGHMAMGPHRENFFEFVTAHSPFELTAIVLSAAAGMRLGFSLVDTGGLTRTAALRRAGEETMPTMGAAVLMFLLAALIEGFVSPSPLPYWVKATVAAVTAGMLVFYFLGLGYPRKE
jgi:uncharacterized membrane protein SpoIIM required for sporulation